MTDYDITGRDILSSKNRIEKYRVKRPLFKTIIYAGLIGGAIIAGGIGIERLVENDVKRNYANPDEASGRARQLAIASEQIRESEDPQTINGLSSVITDVQSGVYDY